MAIDAAALELSESEYKTVAAIQDCFGLKDAELKRMLKQVPSVKSYAFDAASLTALQQRLGLTDAELKAAVLRLPQVLGDNYEQTLAPSLASLQSQLALSDAELGFLVKKLPQLLGLDFEASIAPSLEALQRKDGGLTGESLKEAILSKPANLLKVGVVVRGGSAGSKGRAARAVMAEEAETAPAVEPTEEAEFSFMAPPAGFECIGEEECVLPNEDGGEGGGDGGGEGGREGGATLSSPTSSNLAAAPPPVGFTWGETY